MGVVGILGAVIGSMAGLVVLAIVGMALFGTSSGPRTTTLADATPTPYEPDSDGRVREPTGRPTPTRDEEQDDDTPADTPAQVTLDRTLKSNTVYRAGALSRANCRAGNVSIYSHRQLKALILKTGRCMDKTWGKALARQGIPFSPPNYVVVAGRGRGPCGDYPPAGSIVPYYCPRTSTIYVSTSAVVRGNSNSQGYGQALPWHGAITSVMAHEYGHHVQHLTGLMDSWWSQTLDSTSSRGKLTLSRRLELQATCFGGMAMRSVAGSYPIGAGNRDRLFWLWGQVGDQPGRPRDHGSEVNNNRWFRQGYLKNQAFQCNTWMAPASTIS